MGTKRHGGRGGFGSARRAVIAALAGMLVFAPPSFAQATRDGGASAPSEVRERSAGPAPDRDPGGWVITAYVGGASTRPSSLTISQPALGTDVTFDDVRLSGRSFDPPLYYGARAGYFLPRIPFVGVEAEFIHLKVYSDPGQRVRAAGTYRGEPIAGELPLGRVVQGYSISHGANLLLFNVAARYGVGRGAESPTGRLVLTGRFGLGPTIPHTESTIDGRRQEQYELGRLGWQIAGGAEVRLWRGLYALGEYKFTRTRQRGAIVEGEAESLLRSNHGVFGLSYHF